MIFAKHLVQGILAGHITAARVPLASFASQVWHDEHGQQQHAPVVPETISLRSAQERVEDMSPSEPAKGGEPHCRLIVKACELVTLDEITDEHAQTLGFASADEWADAWYLTYARAVTGEQGYEITFSVDNRERKHTLLKAPWDPGTEDGQYRRAPEPEAIEGRHVREFSRRSREQEQRAQQQLVAWYRERSLAEQLRAIQEDERLSRLAKDDLKVVARRIQKIWEMGDKAA